MVNYIILIKNIYAQINQYVTIIGPKSLYCSCAYYACYCECKHQYALLLKINENGIPNDLMDNVNKMNKNDLVKMIIKIIDKCTLKSLNILKILDDPNKDKYSETNDDDDDDDGGDGDCYD